MGNAEALDSTTALTLSATPGQRLRCTATPAHVTNGIATYLAAPSRRRHLHAHRRLLWPHLGPETMVSTPARGQELV